MNKHILKIATLLLLIGTTSCSNQKTEQTATHDKNIPQNTAEEPENEAHQRKTITDFIPSGYVVFEKIYGDLNKDKTEDCIIIIKGTDKTKFVNDERRGLLDRNRRGLIVLFNKNNNYELAEKNEDCFASENEEGGAYYAPELSVSIEKGNLYIHYAHGRNGYWTYTFRFQKPGFKLIGYDSSDNMGGTVESTVSVNYLTKKRLRQQNTFESDETDIFKETWSDVKTSKLVDLSEIKDFDEFRVPE
ncbi:hypothetical protein [Flavobacterium pedocola]